VLLSIWIEHPEPTAQGEQRHPSFQKVQHRPGHSPRRGAGGFGGHWIPQGGFLGFQEESTLASGVVA